MSSKLSAAELRREQRKKELEEKRAKLKAYREKGKEETTVQPEATSEKDSELNKIANVSSVSDLLDALEIQKPESEQAPEPQPQSTSVAQQTVTKSTVPLILVPKVVDFSIEPKIIPTYAKGTQTVSTQSGGEDDEIPVVSIDPDYKAASTNNNNVEVKKPAPHVFPENEHYQQEEEDKTPELPEIEIQRMLYSQELADFLDDTTRITERALLLNDKFDILQNFKGEVGDSKKDSDAQISLDIKLFDEKWSKNRAVTSIDWSKKFSGLLLASYSENKASAQESDGVVLAWTVENLLDRPEFVFTCQSPVLTAKFPKFQPNIVIGGTYSGQIVLWDTRAKSTPVQRSPLSNVGHTHPIFCLDVVGTKNAHNLVTLSTDGTLCAWSLSNLSQPIEQISLEVPPVAGRSAKYSSPAATSLVFEEGQVNQFYIGTEEGAIYHGARHGSSRGLYERFSRAPVENSFSLEENKDQDPAFIGHCAPITGLDFQTVEGDSDFSSYFLTSSLDWSCKLWHKRVLDRPICTFQQGNDCIYDVKWSPKHPAVFATADGAGKLNIWNLNVDTEVSVVQEQVSPHSLNRIHWSGDGTKIAVGDSVGYLSIYDVNELSTPEDKDWALFEDTINNLPKPKKNDEPSVLDY